MSTKIVNISFEEEQLDALDEFARESGRTRSKIIRMAIDSFLVSHYPHGPLATIEKEDTK